jgi:hypothetical protein
MVNGKRSITIALPLEFQEICQGDGVSPEQVIRGFIADLCHLDGSNGSDERRLAVQYYVRCGYPYMRDG